MVSSLLKNLIKDQIKEHWFFPAIRKSRQHEITKRKESHDWRGQGCKIYPSSLSFDMCVYNYIQNIEKAPDFSLQAIYSMEAGTYKHKELQDQLLKTSILYKKPNCSKDLQEKLEKNWPEVPILDPILNLSGRADGVLSVLDRPVVLEIKTTSLNEKAWMTDFEKYFPKKEHLTQVSIYRYLMNANAYYEYNVDRAILAYLNLLMPIGSQDAEKEIMIDFNGSKYKDLDEKTEYLLFELGKEKTKYLNGEPSECAYELCKVHNGDN